MDGGTLRVGSVSEQRVERLVLGLTDCVTVQQLTDHVMFRTVSCRLRHNVHRLRIQPVYTYDTIRYDATCYSVFQRALKSRHESAINLLHAADN